MSLQGFWRFILRGPKTTVYGLGCRDSGFKNDKSVAVRSFESGGIV